MVIGKGVEVGSNFSSVLVVRWFRVGVVVFIGRVLDVLRRKRVNISFC